MIRPNMATMLGFVATDACVAPGLMPQLARALAESSFNRVTVDGDTSTNDSFIVIATNKAAHAPVQSLQSPEGQALFAALLEVARWLAQAIVRDGEGTKNFYLSASIIFEIFFIVFTAYSYPCYYIFYI